ncbi:MAG: cyclase family protein [Lachnospiraceae bacterium]|nr:cyclase family protein [Lachnospiraceae bacterium]
MQIYDISQEVFSCAVYPGDPSPERKWMLRMDDGAVCNLTAISMCAHNGTHVDAPFHFINEGRKIDEVDMQRWIGYAYVAEHEGVLTAADAEYILATAEAAETAQNASLDAANSPCDASKRILVKGNAVMSEEAARVFAERGIFLFGNESQTVGPEDAPMAVHKIMLGAQVVLLEGIRLAAVPEGVYLLHAAPINLGGADGAPCRATLLRM